MCPADVELIKLGDYLGQCVSSGFSGLLFSVTHRRPFRNPSVLFLVCCWLNPDVLWLFLPEGARHQADVKLVICYQNQVTVLFKTSVTVWQIAVAVEEQLLLLHYIVFYYYYFFYHDLMRLTVQ